MIAKPMEKRIDILKKLIFLELIMMLISGLVMLIAIKYVDAILFLTFIMFVVIVIYWRTKLKCPQCKTRILNINKALRCDNCGHYFETQ